MTDNQETKELDAQWECFCDMAYFDKWAVRNKNDRAFTSAIHVETYDEAQYITEKFNELDVAKEQLTQTQQKLDVAVEALEWAELMLDNIENGRGFGKIEIADCRKSLKAALNTIGGK